MRIEPCIAGLAVMATILLLTGCLFRMRAPRLPSSEEYLSKAKAVVEEAIERAETEGVWWYPMAQEQGDRIDIYTLSRVFSFYSNLGEDYPEDRDRVGVFLADILMPNFLLALDMAKRDLGQEGASNLQVIVGEIFENRYTMEKWHSVIENRLLGGETGLGTLYWARDITANFAAEQCQDSVNRYRSLLERCVAMGPECSEDVRQVLQSGIEGYPRHCGEPN